MKKLLFASLLAICATPASGQHGSASQANCHGLWTAMLASGIPRGDLSRCWAVLQPDVVAAITGSSTSNDILRIATVVNTASGYQTPAVLNAALSVVSDRGATHPARMGSFAIVMSQYRRNSAPLASSTTIAEFLTSDLTFECLWNASYLDHDFEEPLPNDYLERIRRVASSILHTTEDDKTVRAYAGCVVELLDIVSPVKVPASAISVRYRCGSVFVLTNTSDQRVNVRYQVGDGGDETNTIDVPARGETLLPTIAVGRIRVFVGEELAGIAENGGIPCR